MSLKGVTLLPFHRALRTHRQFQSRHIDDVQITLGSSDGGSVTLGAASVKFTEEGLTVTGGASGSSPVNAMLSCQGNVTFALAGKETGGVNGRITVEAMGGALTIDAGDGTFTLTDFQPASLKRSCSTTDPDD